MPLATEIFQEGLIIPPLKLYARGRMNEDVFDLILSNVRTPDERRGDLLAQIAANEIGRARLEEAVARFGAAKVRLYSGAHPGLHGRHSSGRRSGPFPTATYAFEDFLDDDGISDRPRQDRRPPDDPRRPGRRRFQRVLAPDRGRRQRQLRRHLLGRPLCLPVARRGGHPLQHGPDAAPRDRRPAAAPSSTPSSRPPAPGATSRRPSASSTSCSAPWPRPCPAGSRRRARGR